MFPDQEPGGRGHPLKNHPPKIDQFLGWFFKGGFLPHGSWSGNIVNRKPLRSRTSTSRWSWSRTCTSRWPSARTITTGTRCSQACPRAFSPTTRRRHASTCSSSSVTSVTIRGPWHRSRDCWMWKSYSRKCNGNVSSRGPEGEQSGNWEHH